MAIVGEAHVIIRAITDRLANDIQKGLNDSMPAANETGRRMGQNISNGISDNIDVDTSGAEADIDRSSTRMGDTAGRNISSGMADGARDGGREVESASSSSGGRSGRNFMAAFNKGGGGGRVFIAMGLRISALVPIFGALIGAVSTLVNGLFSIGAAAANSIYSVTALAGALAALAQGAIVGMVAFQGIGTAMQAGMKTATAAAVKSGAGLAGAAKDAAHRVRDAAEAIGDAERNAARAIRDAQRAVRDAKENLRDVYWKTARDERDAIESVSDAEQAHKDAIEALDDAQRSLNQAYEDAKDRLLDLQFSQREGALAEQRAALALQDALYKLNATSALPADNRTRIEAIIAYQQAQLDLDEVQANNAQTAQDLASAQDTAAESISDAQNDVSAAQENVSDTARDYNDAIKDQIRLQKLNARAIRDAKEALQGVREALQDAYRDGPRAIRDAKEALEDAKRAQVAANTALAAGSPAAAAFSDAMKKLSPAAQHFVNYLLSIRGEMQKLKFAAQQGLFPGLETALRSLISGPLFPLVQKMMFDTGQAIGSVAKQIANAMNSGPFTTSFARVTTFNAGIIKQFGGILADLADVLFRVLDAARPLTQRFVDWVSALTDGWRATLDTKKGMSDLRNTFKDSGDTMAQLWRITKNLWHGISDLGHVAKPAGNSLLDSFEKATKAFSHFTDTKAKRVELRQLFNDTADNLRAISHLFLVVGGAFTRMGADPHIAKTAKALEPVVKHIETLMTGMLDRSGDSITTLLDSVVTAFDEISKSGSFELFLKVMTTSVNLLVAGFKSPVFGPALRTLLKIGAAMYAISIIRKFPGIGLLLNSLGGAFMKSALWNMIKFNAQMALMVIKQALLTAATTAWAAVVRVATAVQWALNAAWEASPIGLIIVAIVALVAGFVLLYKHSETFRKLVNFLWDSLKKLWSILMDHKILFTLILGPIGVLIIGFKALYQHVGWFRDAVKASFEFVMKAVHWLGDAFKWLWDLLFGHSIIPDMVKGFKAFAGFISAIFSGVMDVVHWLGDAFSWLWTNAIKPVLKLIIDGVSLWWAGVKFVFDAVVNWIKFEFKVAWWLIKNIIIDPIMAAKNKLEELLGPKGPIREKFNDIKNWVVGAWHLAWMIIKSKIIEPINDAKNSIAGFFGAKGPIRQAFSDIKEWVTGTFATAWQAVKGKLTGPIDAAVSAIKSFLSAEKGGLQFIFSEAVSAIGRIWDGLQKLIAKPVIFVIDTIYNQGLRAALNLIPGVDLKEATVPKSLTDMAAADGGVLPGWSPGRDIHRFVSPTAGTLHLSGGEAVMRPEFTKMVGGAKGVEQLNRMARAGVNPFQYEQRHASGGTITVDGETMTPVAAKQLALAEKLSGIAMSVIQGSYQPYSSYSGSSHEGGGVMDTGPGNFSAQEILRKVGFAAWARNQSGYPQSVTPGSVEGSNLHVHSVSIIDPTASGNSQVAAYKAGGNGMGGSDYGPRPAILSNLSDLLGGISVAGTSGVAGGLSPAEQKGQDEKSSWLDLISKFPDAIKGAVSDVKNLGNKFGTWGGVFEDSMKHVGSDMIQWVNDKIPDKIEVPHFKDIPLPNNPIHNPFDMGGLARSEGWMAKGTVRPERVLSPRQTEAFEQLVSVLDKMQSNGATSDGDITLNVQVPQSASAADVVSGITYEMRRQRLGGKYR